METYNINSINTPVPPQRIYPLEIPHKEGNEIQQLPEIEDSSSLSNEKDMDKKRNNLND